jgi:hypothetical protein
MSMMAHTTAAQLAAEAEEEQRARHRPGYPNRKIEGILTPPETTIINPTFGPDTGQGFRFDSVTSQPKPAAWTGPRLIAFSGLAGCGKSTAASLLEMHYGFQRIRFAGPLKDMLRVIGLSNDEIEGDLKEKPCELLCGKTPRQAMQWLGTEWGRQMIGNDFWIGIWRKLAQEALQYKPVVVEDCRFLNEAGAVWALGGTIVRLNGKGPKIDTGHASEAMPFGADVRIFNPGENLHRLKSDLDRLQEGT